MLFSRLHKQQHWHFKLLPKLVAATATATVKIVFEFGEKKNATELQRCEHWDERKREIESPMSSNLTSINAPIPNICALHSVQSIDFN